MHGKILVAVLTSCLLLPHAALAQDQVTIETIPQTVLLDYLAEGEVFTLFDARTAEEYQAGHVYGAINLPHDTDLVQGAVCAGRTRMALAAAAHLATAHDVDDFGESWQHTVVTCFQQVLREQDSAVAHWPVVAD